MEPRRLLEGVVAVAAGNTVTIALRADGSLLQWDVGTGPRRSRVLQRAAAVSRGGFRSGMASARASCLRTLCAPGGGLARCGR